MKDYKYYKADGYLIVNLLFYIFDFVILGIGLYKLQGWSKLLIVFLLLIISLAFINYIIGYIRREITFRVLQCEGDWIMRRIGEEIEGND